MLCTKCNYDNPADALFCMKCGTKVENRCSSCSTVNPVDANFCRKCGAALASSAASLLGSATAAKAQHVEVTLEQRTGDGLDGERKTVTALFADIKDSTELMRDLDPEEARAIVDPALKIMVEAVRRYEGYVVQSTGDGIFALFGAPAAYEDHPQRGLYAALQLRQELREYGQRLVSQGKPALEARVGINTGEVVVRSVETGGKIEYTPIGHTANLASRLQTLAPAGSIAVSEHTRRLVEGYFELRALGPMQVRGVSELVNVYEVTGLGPLRTHFQLSARRGLTKFVGRERQIAEMLRALESAMVGRGQIVAVVADAGTGKSRLFYEFKATLLDECEVLEAYSVSHGKASAWLPVLELLRSYFTIRDGDNPPTRREKVRAKLSTLDPALADTQAYLFALLGIPDSPDPLTQMDPPIKRQRTLDAIKRIILRESLAQPVVVIFEDLHWIDSQTQALLDLLADGLASARVLLVVNYRPEYRHEWGNKSYYSQLRLDALDSRSAGEMLATLLGESAELDPLKRMIIECTGGNPFFVEEIVQALLDEGALLRNGVVRVARPLGQLRLPPTVQGILASRIDRLPGEQKQLLQTLAVMGKEAPLGLVKRVVPSTEGQLEPMLTDLQTGEFIFEQPALADVVYVFKHALTQEVAYSSLLIERRKLLHERVGQALESIFAAQLDDHLVELARHYSHSDNITKAVEYLGRSGQQAVRRSAHADAIVSLNAALELLQKMADGPERIQHELFLHLALGQALSPIKGFSAPGVERAFARARELCERLGDPPELFFVLLGLRGVYFIRGEYRLASELDQQLLLQAQSAKDPGLLSLAHWLRGITCLEIGEMLLAREQLEKSISLYDPERDRPCAFLLGVDPGSGSLGYLGMTLWNLGYPDKALKRGKEGVALAEGLAPQLCANEMFLAFIHQFRGEADKAQRAAENVIALSGEHGFTLWSAIATFMRHWAMIEQGQGDENISQLREALAAYRATEAQVGLPGQLCMLAEACMKTGRLDDGSDALTEALAVADQHEEHRGDAEIHRLRGELVLKKEGSNVAAAQRCFERAIEIAQKQSAKSFELRATTSLARLLARQDRRDEARTMLADIYGWFTEGFDTADLKDAKALLEELNA